MKVKEDTPSDDYIRHPHVRAQKAGLAPLYVKLYIGKKQRVSLMSDLK